MGRLTHRSWNLRAPLLILWMTVHPYHSAHAVSMATPKTTLIKMCLELFDTYEVGLVLVDLTEDPENVRPLSTAASVGVLLKLAAGPEDSMIYTLNVSLNIL